MELSRSERWILANQYRILAALQPGSAEDYERVRIALEEGFSDPIERYAEHIYRDEYTLNQQECSDVVNIMSTFDALQRSFNALEDPAELDGEDVRFLGFDGNNETKYMGYARYVIEHEGRFTYLDRNSDLNSHMLSLTKYRQMLEQWRQLGKRYDLTKDEMLQILRAGDRAL